MVHANRVGGSSPSYKHCLPVLGQYLNQQHARTVTIAEVDTGFMVLFYPEANYRKQRTLMISVADLLEFDGDFTEAARGRKGGVLRNGLSRDKKHPLLPQGYDTVFRALGLKLDQRQATCVTICETPQALYVDYWVANATFVVRDQRRQAISHHQRETYDTAGLRQLQETARLTLEQESGRHRGSLRVNPHDHLSAMQVAFMLEDEGDYAGAEDIFKRVLSQVPEHAEAQYHYARLAHIRGDKRTALQAVRKAVTLRSEIAAVQDLYGRVLRQHGKLADAVAAFEKAVSLDAANPLHHLRLAKAYEAQGRKEEATLQLSFISLPHAAPAWDILEEQLFEDVSVPAVTQPLPVPSPVLVSQAVAAPFSQAAPDVAPLPVEEDFAGAESFDQAWTSPMTADDTQFATALHSMGSAIPLDPPPMSTSFDSISTSSWAPPESQFPTLGASLPSASVSSGLDTSWLEPPAPLAPFDLSPMQPTTTLSERLHAAALPGTGPLAARMPRSIEPEAVPRLQGTPALDPELVAVGQQFTDVTAPPIEFTTVLPLTAVEETVEAMPPVVSTSIPPARIMRTVANQPENYLESGGAVEIAAEILTIQRALESEPNRADLHRKLGFLLARQGHASEAAAEFRRALQCSRTNL